MRFVLAKPDSDFRRAIPSASAPRELNHSVFVILRLEPHSHTHSAGDKLFGTSQVAPKQLQISHSYQTVSETNERWQSLPAEE